MINEKEQYKLLRQARELFFDAGNVYITKKLERDEIQTILNAINLAETIVKEKQKKNLLNALFKLIQRKGERWLKNLKEKIESE